MGLVWTTTLGSGGTNPDLSDALAATVTQDMGPTHYDINLGLSFTSDNGYPSTTPVHDIVACLVALDGSLNWPGEEGYFPTCSPTWTAACIESSGGGLSFDYSFNGIRMTASDMADMVACGNAHNNFPVYSDGRPYVPNNGGPENYWYLKFQAYVDWYDSLYQLTTTLVEEYVSVSKSSLSPP